ARDDRKKRTTPAQFVREAIEELKKVVWPSLTQWQQYFVVVLVFVLFMIAIVTGLDLLFGWVLLRIFG
ncbi:MAG: preprotein translocase subunit SecE, partial [Propionicimonas sp.]|nr:preprotein translocase subunit SecE [Propionicimonas sp.]